MNNRTFETCSIHIGNIDHSRHLVPTALGISHVHDVLVFIMFVQICNRKF